MFHLFCPRLQSWTGIKWNNYPPSPPKAMMKVRRSKQHAILASLKWGGGVVQMFHLFCPRLQLAAVFSLGTLHDDTKNGCELGRLRIQQQNKNKRKKEAGCEQSSLLICKITVFGSGPGLFRLPLTCITYCMFLACRIPVSFIFFVEHGENNRIKWLKTLL